MRQRRGKTPEDNTSARNGKSVPQAREQLWAGRSSPEPRISSDSNTCTTSGCGGALIGPAGRRRLRLWGNSAGAKSRRRRRRHRRERRRERVAVANGPARLLRRLQHPGLLGDGSAATGALAPRCANIPLGAAHLPLYMPGRQERSRGQRRHCVGGDGGRP